MGTEPETGDCAVWFCRYSSPVTPGLLWLLPFWRPYPVFFPGKHAGVGVRLLAVEFWLCLLLVV